MDKKILNYEIKRKLLIGNKLFKNEPINEIKTKEKTWNDRITKRIKQILFFIINICGFLQNKGRRIEKDKIKFINIYIENFRNK